MSHLHHLQIKIASRVDIDLSYRGGNAARLSPMTLAYRISARARRAPYHDTGPRT